ncbi:MAG: ABC transporter ATP-binding protein [Planctomycetaceae bacterium]
MNSRSAYALTESTEPILTVRKLQRLLRRRATEETYLIDAPEMDVAKGDFAVIIGGTGSGKSSLLHILALLEPPDEAEEFRLLDIDLVSAWESEAALGEIRRSMIGIALQQPELLRSLTARENVELPRRLNHMISQGRVDDLLRCLGRPAHDRQSQDDLTRVARHRVKELSGGQKQRIGIARALAHEPPIIFLDEPTSALDPASTQRLLDDLDGRRESEGLTVVAVTHDASVIQRATVLFHMETNAEGGVLREVNRKASANEAWDAVVDASKQDSTVVSHFNPAPFATTHSQDRSNHVEAAADQPLPQHPTGVPRDVSDSTTTTDNDDNPLRYRRSFGSSTGPDRRPGASTGT